MAVGRNPDNGEYMAQCDKCRATVDFESGEGFFDVKQALDEDGWRVQKVNGKWFNTCVDCAI